MMKRLLLSAGILAVAANPAFAHLNPGEHGSFLAGFSHPLFGLDHILVMVAVGLWAAMQGGSALYLVPISFVATMTLGFAAAIFGLPLPFVEPVILASVVFIGLMIALALPLPIAGVMAVVAFFAFFHGHAHGGELGEAGAWPFAVGFAIATALLHIVGIGIGLALGRLHEGPFGKNLTRVAGGLTAAGGLWLAFGG